VIPLKDNNLTDRFITVVELPAWALLGFWFVLQAVFGGTRLVTPAGGEGGVAYFAHVGGFAFGLLVVRRLAPRHRLLSRELTAY
jgi:membrane associated rhomboid family serine protease